MKIPRVAMAEQPASERARCFMEVNRGLASEQAVLEATRCLQCKQPDCIDGCPVGVDIPGFVRAVAEGDLPRAADILYAANVLPGITGRVCPQETQCEVRCILGKKHQPLAVGYLERFVADWAREHRNEVVERAQPTGRRVAVVGSGPAGLTCAGELARRGHEVTVFEALHRPGGVLVYGIPEFRLPKVIVDMEVAKLMELGVRVECNVVVGQTHTIQQLMGDEGYHAVFIANGAGLPRFQGIPGENLKGVYSANEYLTRVNLMGAYQGEDAATPVLRGRGVVVVGGGNTAMDAVRTGRRLGADPATLVYRRSEAEMPARVEEVHHAREEGIVFRMLTNPVEVLGDEKGWVRAVRCQQMGLGEPDASGRRSPVPIPGSEFEIDCQVFVEAVGTRANPLLTQSTPELKLDRWGQIKVDERGMTNLPGVFAGGDIVRGGATVILAMGDGKRAASAIHDWFGCASGG
ncbi:MAG: NADPH-dependent glutamate synthase [Polyangiaceae bacterium]|nr:NADPH-dependent glutamate synthase [Polyangiaceae bacterium]